MCHESMVVVADCAGYGCGYTGYRVSVPVDVAMDRGCVELNKLVTDSMHRASMEVEHTVCRVYGLTPKQVREMPWETVMKMYEAAIR